jgi:hypothetical protein
MSATAPFDNLDPVDNSQWKMWLKRAWVAFKPLLVLVAAVLAGLVLAILLKSAMQPMFKALGEVLAWLVLKLQRWVPNLDPVAGLDRKIDIGIGAFGLVVVLSVLKDTHESITRVLLSWRKADRSILLPAFSTVTVAFAALGLSVYGIGGITASSSPLISLDAAIIPPAVVNPEKGDVTFFVSFLDEGGRDSMLDPGHMSIQLRATDKEFLERLASGLSRCSAKGDSAAPSLFVRGFASSSLWTTASTELEAMSRGPGANDAIRNAYDELQQYASKDDTRSRDLAVARAFNVYLANKRRSAVVDVLRQNGGANLIADKGIWDSYPAMDNAIAIEDRGIGDTAAAAGILTRSVAITIDAGGCSRANKYSRIELSIPRT